MDVTNLVLYLRSTITCNSLDQQMVSKAIRMLELGAVKTTSSVATLPTASVSNIGEIYLVLYDGLYWSTGVTWLPMSYTIDRPVYAWGCNASYQLGNTGTSRSSPTSIFGGILNWSQVSSGASHTMTIRADATAWGWGSGDFGKLGNNNTFGNCTRSPGCVVGGFSDWQQVSAGGAHTFGLRSNGSVWTWGLNNCGQLGNNSTFNAGSPVSVVGGFTDWCQVSAGWGDGDAGARPFGLAVRTNGTAWGWGSNSYGQLGSYAGVNLSSPVSVVGGFTDWCQVKAGSCFSLGLRTNGTAWGWGRGNNGQLGDRNATSRSSPVSVVGGFTDWCELSTGYFSSAGLRTNGTAWTWGSNGSGQLGNDGSAAVNQSSPVSVVGGFTTWCDISVGGQHVLATRTDSSLWAWGYNGQGQIGDNSVSNRSSPVSVAGGLSGWTQASAGRKHSSATGKFATP